MPTVWGKICHLTSPDVSMQSSSVEKSDLSHNQHNAEAEQIDSSFPADYSGTNSRIKGVLKELGRYQDSRTHNPPLLLDDLTELGMVGELSEDNKFITMSFEDVHRLVTTMKMTELILNDCVHFDRKEKKSNKSKSNSTQNIAPTWSHCCARWKRLART